MKGKGTAGGAAFRFSQRLRPCPATLRGTRARRYFFVPSALNWDR
jgi:hypothetical protein